MSIKSFATALEPILDQGVQQGWLRSIDRALAAFLHTEGGETDPGILLLAALTSQQLGHGHTCIHLASLLADPGKLIPHSAGDTFCKRLSELKPELVEKQLNCSPVVGEGPGSEPLVYQNGRLYLRRYWQYQQSVAEGLQRLLCQPRNRPQDLSVQLARLFPEGNAKGKVDWQKVACALATRSNLTLITGGPGTGKTTTVVRLLGLLQDNACKNDKPLRIRLAAPTGKAAARLTQSISDNIAKLPVGADVKALIPADVVTLHRLLGRSPQSRHFRHHRDNPLHADLVVIDEASMIDLEMMACLLDALGPRTALILIGDKDQLASVEAGAVMGDLCGHAEDGNYPADTVAWVKEICDMDISPFAGNGSALAAQTVMLRDNHRFGNDSGINALATAINRGDRADAEALWQCDFRDISSIGDDELEPLCLEGYRGFITLAKQNKVTDREQHATAVLKAFADFQLLCPLRDGPAGVTGLNERIAAHLHKMKLITQAEGWYEGRPVIVTRNDYALGLMNGDVGVALREDPDRGEKDNLRVAFQLPDGRIKRVLPSRLDNVETVYAMTVHKSQGSEFAHTALVLPKDNNPVLTRELLYTAVTRAREHFTLIADDAQVLVKGVERPTQRASGLVGLMEV